MVKRKPFDFLAERPFLKNGRGDWRKFEPNGAVISLFIETCGKLPRPLLRKRDG
jgi:hypothetical protein